MANQRKVTEPMLWRLGSRGFELVEKSKVGDHERWHTEHGVPKGWINPLSKGKLIVTPSSERGIQYLDSVVKRLQILFPNMGIIAHARPGGWEEAA